MHDPLRSNSCFHFFHLHWGGGDLKHCIFVVQKMNIFISAKMPLTKKIALRGWGRIKRWYKILKSQWAKICTGGLREGIFLINSAKKTPGKKYVPGAPKLLVIYISITIQSLFGPQGWLEDNKNKSFWGMS